MVLVAAIVLVFIVLYAVWKEKYRYPPHDHPQSLCYHKVTNRFCFEGTWTTPVKFFSQVDYLIEKGYEFISEEEFLSSLGVPSPAGGKRLLLTFDDGYREIYDLLPGLEERGVRVLVFLVAAFAGLENSWDWSLTGRTFVHLSWSEMREMVGRGVSFGSHGMTHADLRRLSFDECQKEIKQSKLLIEEELGREVKSFSYPFGRYNDVLMAMVEDTGYQAAFSLYPQHPNERIARYALRRSGVYIIDGRRTVARKLERGSLFWFEEMKCRAINTTANLNPLFKRLCSYPGR